MVRKVSWVTSGSSGTDAEKENSQAAPDSDRQLIITGFTAVVRAAAAIGDVLITLEDADNNVLYTDYFGDAAARGTRIGVVFGEDSGIPVPNGVGAKIVTAAGGTAAIITSNMWGIEI